MKKLIGLSLALILALSLVACGGSDSGTTDETITLDTAAISSSIDGVGLFVDTLEPISEDRITTVTGIDISGCKSAEYHLGAGATAEEWGVFECNSVDDAKTLVTALEKHCDELLSTYESYAPDAVPRINNAVIERAGQYVVFVTAEKYDDAKTLVEGLMK